MCKARHLIHLARLNTADINCLVQEMTSSGVRDCGKWNGRLSHIKAARIPETSRTHKTTRKKVNEITSKNATSTSRTSDSTSALSRIKHTRNRAENSPHQLSHINSPTSTLPHQLSHIKTHSKSCGDFPAPEHTRNRVEAFPHQLSHVNSPISTLPHQHTLEIVWRLSLVETLALCEDVHAGFALV